MRLSLGATLRGLGVLSLILALIGLLGMAFEAAGLLLQGMNSLVAAIAPVLVTLLGASAFFWWAIVVVSYTRRAGRRRSIGLFTLVGVVLLCVPAGYSHLRGTPTTVRLVDNPSPNRFTIARTDSGEVLGELDLFPGRAVGDEVLVLLNPGGWFGPVEASVVTASLWLAFATASALLLGVLLVSIGEMTYWY